MEEMFGLTKYIGWTASGRQVYGCRGQGEQYKQFWSDIKNVKFAWEHDNWPWSYFTFNDKDEEYFLKKYNDIIDVYDDKSGQYDSIYDTKPSTLTKEQRLEHIMLNSILTEEIQKEINRSIIEQINESATNFNKK